MGVYSGDAGGGTGMSATTSSNGDSAKQTGGLGTLGIILVLCAVVAVIVYVMNSDDAPAPVAEEGTAPAATGTLQPPAEPVLVDESGDAVSED